MPPFKVKAACLQCKWNRTAYQMRAMHLGDRHADDKNHSVQFWRISNPPEFMGVRNPVNASGSW